jgi:hypothetical protein
MKNLIRKENLPEFLVSNWFERLIKVALAVLIIAILQSWVLRREYKKDLENRPCQCLK